MSDLSDYAENLVVKWLLTDDSVTRPTNWYVGLYTSSPSDAGGGTEVSGGGYARQACTFTASGDTATGSQVTFTASGGDWGTIVHLAAFDAISGGNLIYHKAAPTPTAIADGQSLIVNPSFRMA